jgi:hypothetical protein
MPRIQSPIDRGDIKFLSRTEVVGIILEDIKIAPQHGLGFYAEVLRNPKQRITLLDMVLEDNEARSIREHCMQLINSRNAPSGLQAICVGRKIGDAQSGIRGLLNGLALID